jgi:hypothetical protein
MFVSSRQWIGLPATDPLAGDETPGSTTRAALVPPFPPKGEPEPPHGSPGSTSGKAALPWHPPAMARNGDISRRTFLRSTAACPVLLTMLSPIAALADFSAVPRGAVTAESETFWDDGTGWV